MGEPLLTLQEPELTLRPRRRRRKGKERLI